MAESPSPASTGLDERFFDDPSQLSQLLRQRAGSDAAFTLTTATQSQQLGFTAAAPHCAVPLLSLGAVSTLPTLPTLQPPVVTAPFTRALSPRRVASAGNVKPALPIHHSAPVSAGFVKEMTAALKMHHSFPIDAPGDTQPDSQIYKQYTSGIHPAQEPPIARNESAPKSLFEEHVVDDDADSRTIAIDSIESSQDQQSHVTSPTAIHDDDVLGALPLGHYAPTSPLKFETPAIAGRKRDSSGHMLSSAVRTNMTTPGTAASTIAFAFPGFAADGLASMSLTQVWQNTQAPTSPAPAEPSEDLAFTRPSPTFAHARPSSPADALSSPIKAVRDETLRHDPAIRSSSEPRTEYVSMKESQERRKRRIDEQPVLLIEQDSWEMPSAAQLRVQKRKLREDLERKAAMSFAHVSAPAPPSLQPSKKRGRNTRADPPISPHLRPAGECEDGENPTEELAHAIPQNGHMDDGSPDAILQDAAFTTRTTVKHNGKHNRVQVPKTSSHPSRTQSGHSPHHSPQLATPNSHSERDSYPQAPASQPLSREAPRPHSSHDSVAIMDSQPDATANYQSFPRPKSLRFPSSPSVNQYSINQTTMGSKTGLTSQVISSSVPLLPPRLTPEETVDGSGADILAEDEEGVPSSPPVSAFDGSMTYDEHDGTYDEYVGDCGSRVSIEPESGDDKAPTEEEDLPLAHLEPEDGEMSNLDQNIKEDEELKLVQPEKADIETDQEVPETLEQEDSPHAPPEARTRKRSPCTQEAEDDDPSAPPAPSRTQRQDTVPETDSLEETQLSCFPENGNAIRNEAAPVVDSGLPHQPNSTKPPPTAHEHASGSQHDRTGLEGPKETSSDAITTGERLRSMQDIYNLPDTQQPEMEDEIEIPHLSGFDDKEEDLRTNSSPARPSAKRHKVTYAAKRNAFRTSQKPTFAPVAESNQPAALPLNQAHRASPDTPPTSSAQDREEQGAKAAVYARKEAQAPYTRQATLKTKARPKARRVQTQKKGALKPVDRDLLLALSSPAESPSKPNSGAVSQKNTPITPSKQAKRNAEPDLDVHIDEERDELADPTPEHLKEAVVTTVSDHGEVPTSDLVAPNRVLASWPGSHFYPAICFGRVVDHQLQIRFDDGNITTLDATQVRAFDLRLGDHVKVDKTGIKKHTYVVVGFENKIVDVGAKGSPTTDCHGYATIVLEEKRRDSLFAAKAAQPAERISVPMGDLYLTTQLWTRLRDRAYNFSPSNTPSKSTSRIGTPIATVDTLTTASFSRRGMTAPSLLRNATGRAASVASSSARSGSGIFSNMAFVLTSTAMDVDKEEVSRVIKTNGGLVLEQGFHELFDPGSADAPPSQSRRKSNSATAGHDGLILKPAYKDLGFVALISDSHSRSTKYIQALALNVPCLHLRWVQDSIAASRPVAFTKYLLAAGVSKFLDPNGVVRSRTMIQYDPAAEDLSFAQTISRRDLLLQGQTVLLITGRSKKEIEKRQPFVFLTHALGSATVGRCADLCAATDMIRDAQWDWIYVDNGEVGVAGAAAELFGKGKPGTTGKTKKGKKRKRDDSDEKEELVARGQVNGKKVKITCAEFVIQSLILGALVEE